MKQIIHFVNIAAPSAKVFAALTTGDGLAGWWSTDLDGAGAGKVGGVIRFRFETGFNPHMEVTELSPGASVSWKCVAGHDNWAENTFSFAVSGTGDASGLMFRQHYARELDDQTYGIYNYNWGYYLASLARLCQTGTGTPFTPA